MNNINSVEVKPVGVSSVEVNPVEVKTVKIEPVEVNPVEVKTVKIEPVEVNPVEVNPVEVNPVIPAIIGNVKVFEPQSSHETIRLEITNGGLEEIFVPKRQTHKISVVRGQVVLVVLPNNTPQEIPLDETSNKVVLIPPNVPYGFTNLHLEPCTVINAVLHLNPEHKLDHYSVEEPLVYESVNFEAYLQVKPK